MTIYVSRQKISKNFKSKHEIGVNTGVKQDLIIANLLISQYRTLTEIVTRWNKEKK
jgi:hypothetical protein